MRRYEFRGKWGRRGKKSIVLSRALRKAKGEYLTKRNPGRATIHGVKFDTYATNINYTEGAISLVDCDKGQVIGTYVNGYPISISALRVRQLLLAHNHSHNASIAGYVVRESPGSILNDNRATREANMSDRKSVGFDFDDSEDAKLNKNESHGHDVGFSGRRSKNAELNDNKSLSSQAIDIKTQIIQIKSLIEGSGLVDQNLAGIIFAVDSIDEEVSKSDPDSGMLRKFLNYIAGSATAVMTGALGNIAADKLSNLPELLHSLSQSVNSII